MRLSQVLWSVATAIHAYLFIVIFWLLFYGFEFWHDLDADKLEQYRDIHSKWSLYQVLLLYLEGVNIYAIVYCRYRRNARSLAISACILLILSLIMYHLTRLTYWSIPSIVWVIK